jgi:sugar phosphate isomerase/epimerase
MGKIAVNISSVRKHAPEETFGIVERFACIGYAGVEFIRYTGVPAGKLRKVLDENGIVASGIHIAYENLVGDFNAVLDYSLEIGAPFIVCPRLPEPMHTIEGARQAVGVLHKVAERCREHGIRLMYQHHEWELGCHNGTSALDAMAKVLPEALLFFQFETYWITACRINGPELLNRYRNRCASIHIGDKFSEISPEYTELGKGIVDIKKIVEIGERIGIEWYNVQQEHYTQDMFAALEHNYVYLENMLHMVHGTSEENSNL